MSMNIPPTGTGAFGLCCGQDSPSASGRPATFSGQNLSEDDSYLSQNDEKSKKSQKKESLASSLARFGLQLVGAVAVSYHFREKGFGTQLLIGIPVGAFIGGVYS